MSKRRHPVTIQVMDKDTEEWSDYLLLHALQINKTGGGESFAAGAEQYHPRLSFKFRYCEVLQEVAYNAQLYRIVHNGHNYNIKDHDDFMEEHRMLLLVGEAYG